MIRGLFLAFVLLTAPALAQGRPTLELILPPPAALTTEGPAVRVENVISDKSMQELLQSGFPAQLHYRVELWSAGGIFHTMRRAVEWDVIVRYDAVAGNYRVANIRDDKVVPIGQFARFAEAVAEVERPYRAPIVAQREPGRQYYTATVEVVTLSFGDLDELERWLRGDAGPAVQGNANPGTALGRGVRKLFARLVGGERRNLRARSGTFRAR
ncbi:MAG: hypothetical protein ABI877_14040 [Gemmatimonadaceae bacterium]